jgi:hypothetical protein
MILENSSPGNAGVINQKAHSTTVFVNRITLWLKTPRTQHPLRSNYQRGSAV